MANKFTKSVLERQAKERRQHPDGQAEGERQAPASTAPGAFAPGGTAAEMPLQDMHSGAAAQAEHPEPPAADSGSREIRQIVSLLDGSAMRLVLTEDGRPVYTFGTE